jgi:pimeloyl-ACP methyl ester carboxylesterase
MPATARCSSTCPGAAARRATTSPCAPGSAARVVASSTDADEEEPPGAPENPLDGLPPDVAARVEAAFEREATVSTPEECREVWLDQMPFFAVDVERAAAMLDDVVFQPEAHHEHDLGDLHALEALAASEIPVLAIVGAEERFGTGAAERIASTAPHGELIVIEGAGHFPFAETPERYWPALIGWLDRS